MATKSTPPSSDNTSRDRLKALRTQVAEAETAEKRSREDLKAAKAEYKTARKRYKKARKSAKELRKHTKALRSEFEAAKLKNAAALRKTAARKRRKAKRVVSKRGSSQPARLVGSASDVDQRPGSEPTENTPTNSPPGASSTGAAVGLVSESQ